MDKNRHIQRQPVTVHRDCTMGVITFDHLDWTDYNASILDISMNGVGIESNSRTEPGFVWFRNPIWGQQSGVLLWSKQFGTRYRSGIRFASLPSDAEAFVKNQIESSMPHQPLKDLEKIIKIMIEHIKEDSGSGGGMIIRRSDKKTTNCRLDNKQ